MVPSQWRTRRIEDNTRLENESRDIEDGQVLNKGMKDDGITMTGDDLQSAPERFILLADP